MKKSSQPSQPVGPPRAGLLSWRGWLEPDVAALRTSLARHPDLFRYLRAVVRLGSPAGQEPGSDHAQGVTAGGLRRR